jgi:hypothetical protein
MYAIFFRNNAFVNLIPASVSAGNADLDESTEKTSDRECSNSIYTSHINKDRSTKAVSRAMSDLRPSSIQEDELVDGLSSYPPFSQAVSSSAQNSQVALTNDVTTYVDGGYGWVITGSESLDLGHTRKTTAD